MQQQARRDDGTRTCAKRSVAQVACERASRGRLRARATTARSSRAFQSGAGARRSRPRAEEHPNRKRRSTLALGRSAARRDVRVALTSVDDDGRADARRRMRRIACASAGAAAFGGSRGSTATSLPARAAAARSAWRSHGVPVVAPDTATNSHARHGQSSLRGLDFAWRLDECRVVLARESAHPSAPRQGLAVADARRRATTPTCAVQQEAATGGRPSWCRPTAHPRGLQEELQLQRRLHGTRRPRVMGFDPVCRIQSLRGTGRGVEGEHRSAALMRAPRTNGVEAAVEPRERAILDGVSTRAPRFPESRMCTTSTQVVEFGNSGFAARDLGSIRRRVRWPQEADGDEAERVLSVRRIGSAETLRRASAPTTRRLEKRRAGGAVDAGHERRRADPASLRTRAPVEV